MTQDSLGFVWIATLDGLNRFDGYNFKVYRSDDSVKSVSDNWISCITTDRSGNIWYGTRTAGIGQIDYKSGKFINYKERLLSEFGEESLNIQNLFITSEGKILIGTWGAGLLIFDPPNSVFTQYKNNISDNNSISEDKVYAVYEDSKGNLWAGTQRTGLNKLDINTGKFTRFDLISDDPNIVSNNFVLTITEDFKGDIWAGTYSNGLFKISQPGEKIIRYDAQNNLPAVRISKVFEDSSNNLWICTNGTGIFKYIRHSNKFINYRNNQFNTNSLNSDKVWSMMQDKNGLFWFGTLTNGINIFNYQKNKFKRLVHNSYDKNTIIDNYIKGLMFDIYGKLWIGTQTGISILSPDQSIKHLSEKSGLNVGDIRAVYERKNGEIWIGTWGGGINIYDRSASKFSYILNKPGNKNSLADNYLRCILEIDDKVYIGTERGLNEYSPGTGKFKLYDHDDNDPTSISNSQITCLYYDSKNNLWAGTNKGLNILDREKGIFKRIDINGTDLVPQRSIIRKIYEDSNGTIWIGTLGAGFAKYDNQSGKFHFYNQKDGLSNNAVFEILEDNLGYLWISTGIGLNKFDVQNEEFTVYTVADGLPNNEFNAGAAVKNSNGDLYFGGVNGLTYFDPASLGTNQYVPGIEITRVSVNGIEYNKYGFYNSTGKIELPYNKNYINISFTALDFADPESNTFSYKLDGLNDNWVSGANGNTAVFTNLSPGEYLFRVKGANKSGNWNNEGKTLRIIINPPWWDNVYARIIYIILFFVIIYSAFKFRIKNMQSKQALLENLVNERTIDLQKSKIQLEQAVAAKDKLFSIIAHDLKNPFVALLGYSELLKKNDTDLSIEEKHESIDNIYNASTSVYSLLDNLLAWARLQLSNIESYPAALDAALIVENVFKIFSISASIKSIKLKNDINEKTLIFADQDMTEIIFRNIVSNAIKFTPNGGTVKISAVKHNDKTEIIVEDNGIGINEETLLRINMNEGHQISSDGTSKEKGTGLGIMLVKEFISQNNGTFKIESKLGEGTKISISFKSA